MAVRAEAPGKEAIKNCMEIAATNPDAANYFLDQLKRALANVDKSINTAPLLTKISEFVDNVHMQRDFREDPWYGNIEIKTDFQNLQQNLAKDAADRILQAENDSIKMDFALSEQADFLRAFSPSDKAITTALDRIFNYSLATKKMISKGGAIYEANENGEIQTDKAGNPIRANAENVKKIIKAVFQKYLEEKGIKVTTQEKTYPEKKPQVVTKPEVKAPEQPTVEVTTPEVSPAEAETPTTKAGGGMGGA
ncbi:MAG: hypothetical protein Q8M03_10060 [Legionella sp.]|nr:hypothetical protein [Legionella sp.]